MDLEHNLDENFLDGTLDQAVKIVAVSASDPIETSVLLEASRRLGQSRHDLPRLLDDIEKLTTNEECITWCEGCSAPLLTCDDYVTGDDCSTCWQMAEGDWPDKPCYAYRVGKKSAAERYRNTDNATNQEQPQ